jgi:predicted metal-dependent HD superfamily phosphohydrolase
MSAAASAALAPVSLDPDHAALEPLVHAGFGRDRIAQVLSFYDEPHRCYHDRRHLREMFDEALALGLPLAPAEALALLFHDAVYVPGAARGSNEMMSAQMLRVYCGSLSSSIVDAACRIVVDTAEHVATDPGSEYVLDLDLMRLAAPPAQFDEYSRQVFTEQRPLIMIRDDGEAWRYFEQRRVAFFRLLLERQEIFNLPVFRARYGQTARINLQRATDR